LLAKANFKSPKNKQLFGFQYFNLQIQNMAILENGNLKGLVGNLVFRKSNEKTIVQTAPGRKTKQTKGTKSAATDFGHASTAGSRIRHVMGEVHLKLHDSNMHNRLINQLKRVTRPNRAPLGEKTIRGGNIDRIVNFQFNDKCHMHDYMHFDPEIKLLDKKQIAIKFPKFDMQNDIHRPKYCNLMKINLMIVVFNFEKQIYVRSHKHQIPLSLQADPRTVELEELRFDVNDRHAETVLIGMSIEYYERFREDYALLNSKDLHPAAIVGAFIIES